MALTRLYKHRVDIARTQFDFSEYDLGLARDLASNTGVPPESTAVARRPASKRPRVSTTGRARNYPNDSAYIFMVFVALLIRTFFSYLHWQYIVGLSGGLAIFVRVQL